jgi:osmoprotectant transport system permease protein
LIRTLVLVLIYAAPLASAEPTIRIGSKSFTESVVLGEIVTQLLNDAGIPAAHQASIGGSQVLWQALLHGEIDVYPEYTGTLLGELLRGQLDEPNELESALVERGLILGPRLGFNNTYAIGMSAARAGALGIRRVSDLRAYPGLRLGFTSEFMARSDGWPGLKRRYALPQDARGLEHEMAYRGLLAGELDVVDFYSTDPQIAIYQLHVLEDDRAYFPEYQAVLIYRAERRDVLAPVVRRLAGSIDAERMARMNARAQSGELREGQVAAAFLAEEFAIAPRQTTAARFAIAGLTLEHCTLVGISLSAAVLLGLPLGILAARRARLGQVILSVVGLFQTIPSLALLVLMIPLLGIGATPAIAALFLYSLLPIVRNTHSGLVSIPRSLIDSADVMGLSRRVRLRRIEIPLALPSILAGIKTAAVINVGTATLGALIGAGGYGQPIVTGIRLNDMQLILAGAIPAAVLALLVQGLFELLEKLLVPRGLRI